MNIKVLLILIVIFPLFCSCVSLHEVNAYANTSAIALNTINRVNYSFSDYCQEDCDLQQMKSGKIDTLFKCECEDVATKADDAIQKMHYTLTAYLVAMEQLSNNKNFTYDVSGLTTKLQQNPLLHLTDEQVDVYNKAGNFIATAATSFYRAKKLNQYIEQADPLFQQLTETFIFLLNNRLRTQLRIGYEIKLANIHQMIDNIRDDKGFRQLAIRWYLEENKSFKRRDSLISNYAALLRPVQQGHHELYLHRNNLNAKETKELIKRYQFDIQDLVAASKK